VNVMQCCNMSTESCFSRMSIITAIVVHTANVSSVRIMVWLEIGLGLGLRLGLGLGTIANCAHGHGAHGSRVYSIVLGLGLHPSLLNFVVTTWHEDRRQCFQLLLVTSLCAALSRC